MTSDCSRSLASARRSALMSRAIFESPTIRQIGRAHVLTSLPTDIYTLSLHDALPICVVGLIDDFRLLAQLSLCAAVRADVARDLRGPDDAADRTSTRPDLSTHRYLHSFPTRRSSDLRRRLD